MEYPSSSHVGVRAACAITDLPNSHTQARTSTTGSSEQPGRWSLVVAYFVVVPHMRGKRISR